MKESSIHKGPGTVNKRPPKLHLSQKLPPAPETLRNKPASKPKK